MADSFSACAIGAYDEQYPRNQIIRAGLEDHGWNVVSCPLPRQLNTRRKLPLLWRSMRQEAPRCDVFILAEFNQLLAPFAVTMGRLLRRPVLVDYMVGLYDASVQDRETTAPRSARALIFRLVDRWNLATAPGIFTDTNAHRAAFGTFAGRAAERLEVVPVGAYDRWWLVPPTPNPSPTRGEGSLPLSMSEREARGEGVRVQFFGNFIPFHGVEVILEAAALLRDDPRFHFELIGRGQTYRQMKTKAEALGLDHVEWTDPLPPPDLPARVRQADVCLGVFGSRAKTDYVIPNKIYQCLASGKPLITAQAEALREAFTPGEHLLTVPPGDPGALANTLRSLADDPAERQRLAEAGAARIREAFTPQEVVMPLIALASRTARG